MKNNNGFTLVEMMIVLFVITILLLITIPNVTQNNEVISNKGCEGLVNMVQAQVQAYWIEEETPPADLTELQTKGFLNETDLTCPNGKVLQLKDGVVSAVDSK